METVKVGVIGTGFIGPAHVEALRRIGHIEVVALAEVDQATAKAKADALGIPRAYGDYRELLEDDEVIAVHNCTPNKLHYPVNRAILEAGKHCISEKPLAMNSDESRRLVELAEQSGLVHAMNFNYRLNPLVQHARVMIERGEIGEVRHARGAYAQDWLLKPTDYNWRINVADAGPSRCFADIGSHWCDTVQTLAGAHIDEVMADFTIVHDERLRPRGEVESFAGKQPSAEGLEPCKVETEDLAMVMMKLSNGATASLVATQVSAGFKNAFTFTVDGSEASISWDQERPNELWIGHRDRANEKLVKDPDLLHEEIAELAHFPGGHPEGYPVGTKNMCLLAYRDIRAGGPAEKPLYATFQDGHAEMCIVDAAVESARDRRWTKVER